MALPLTRYARSGDLSIAYQVVGDGPVDLVYVPGWISHLDFAWEEPAQARYLERLGSFSRLVRFDKRGTGLSEPVSTVPTLEERMDDVRAVMDAVGIERAALFGVSEGGQMSLLFAATYLERCQALIVYGTFAKGATDATYRWGLPYLDAAREAVEHWGEGRSLAILNPSLAADARQIEVAARQERLSASPLSGAGAVPGHRRDGPPRRLDSDSRPDARAASTR